MGGGEVVLYEAADGQIRLDVRLERESARTYRGLLGGSKITITSSST